MKQKYSKWMIAVLDLRDCKGKCKQYCEKMKESFPELHLVRGHYIDPLNGKYEHWWLLDPDGFEIIDPTCTQFPSCGTGEYVEWIEGMKEPQGRCTNCGEYCYDSTNFCSDQCRLESKKKCGYKFVWKL